MAYNKETGMYEGYIYLILNDIHPGKIYVGQTTTELITRWRGHIGQIKDHTQTDKLHNAMKKYGVNHFAMDGIEKCSACTKKELIKKLDNREKYYVNLFDSYYNGYNSTKGGRDGKEHQMRKVKQFDIYGNYIDTYESIDKLKEKFDKVSSIYSCCYGDIKYAYGHIWRYAEDELNDFELPNQDEISEALSRYYSLFEIDKYDYRGNLICTYKNINDAIENENVKRHIIVDCCTGKRVYVGTNIFRFHHENFNSYKTFRDKPKLVEQYDLDGNFINVYKSARDAGKSIGGSYQSIAQVCRNEMKTAYGYLWRYVENDFVIPDLKHNGHCKKVYKYNKNCELLEIYNSISEAAEANNLTSGTIINCCKNYTNSTCHEYTYSYTKLSKKEIKDKFKNKKNIEINMYDLNGNFIRTFDSQLDAGRFIGKKHAAVHISACCNKRKKTAYGYKWYKSNDISQPNLINIA